jgi:hypothetical protein
VNKRSVLTARKERSGGANDLHDSRFCICRVRRHGPVAFRKGIEGILGQAHPKEPETEREPDDFARAAPALGYAASSSRSTRVLLARRSRAS